MGNALLIAAGPNRGTLTNVLFSINHYIGSTHDIDKVLMLDIQDSGPATASLSSEGIYESAKQALNRDVEVRQRKIDSDAQVMIPRIVVDGAREVGRTNVIVDITSGNKTASAILYASASFCRLEHIYYVNVQRNPSGFPNLWEEPEPQKHFTVINLAPLQEVQHLAALSHFDLIYYFDTLDRLDSVASNLVRNEVKEVTHHIRSSLRLFFELRDNLASMQAIGTATEHAIGIVWALVNSIDEKASITSNTNLKEWNDSLRKKLKQRSGPDFSRQSPMTHSLDFAVEILINWRNAAKHRYPPNFSAQDVRTAMNLIIDLLEAVVLLVRPIK